MGMNNVGTVIGALVGVFVALIVGLNLFEEVVDVVVELQPDYRTGYIYTVNGASFDIDNPAGSALIASDSATYANGVLAGSLVFVSAADDFVENTVYPIEKSNDAPGDGGICTGSGTATTCVLSGGGSDYGIGTFIATEVISDILPTIILIGLLIAGSIIGAVIGRQMGNNLG